MNAPLFKIPACNLPYSLTIDYAACRFVWAGLAHRFVNIQDITAVRVICYKTTCRFENQISYFRFCHFYLLLPNVYNPARPNGTFIRSCSESNARNVRPLDPRQRRVKLLYLAVADDGRRGEGDLDAVDDDPDSRLPGSTGRQRGGDQRRQEPGCDDLHALPLPCAHHLPLTDVPCVLSRTHQFHATARLFLRRAVSGRGELQRV